jgi:hypothetical protein
MDKHKMAAKFVVTDEQGHIVLMFSTSHSNLPSATE